MTLRLTLPWGPRPTAGLLLGLLLGAGPAFAQAKPAATTFTLAARPEPRPALRYRLLPEMRDLKSGNAVPVYLRAFSPEWQSHRRDAKAMQALSDLQVKPLRTVTLADLNDHLALLESRMLREVDRGARRTTCDWELLDRVREDGIGLLLPDLQGFRELIGLLRLRGRREVLEGRYDRAAETIQTGMTLARHLTEGPTLIHGLVGVAGASLMLDVVEAWIDQPGSPNLYWCLSNLPDPLLDLRRGVQGERIFVDHLFPGFREALADPARAAELSRSPEKFLVAAPDLGLGARTDPRLLSLRLALTNYPRAKRQLVARGFAAEKVEAMSVMQVVFLAEVALYDLEYDDLQKWFSLPYHLAAPRIRELEARLRKAQADAGGSLLAPLLVPAVGGVVRAPAHLQRRVAALRCVEALRLHAAQEGRLPASLADVKIVPVPLDPMTGLPFGYSLTDGLGVLTGPSPAGEPPSPSNPLRYEFTLRDGKEKK